MKMIDGVIIEEQAEIGATLVGSFSYCYVDKAHKAQVKKNDHQRYIERRKNERRAKGSDPA